MIKYSWLGIKSFSLEFSAETESVLFETLIVQDLQKSVHSSILYGSASVGFYHSLVIGSP